MPFPTDDTTSVAYAAERLASIARVIKGESAKYIAQCDAGSVNAHDLIAMVSSLLQPARAQWATLAAISGVQLAVRTRYPNAGYANDAAVTADLSACLAAIDSTLLYVVTNTPKDGSGYVLTLQISGNQFVQRVVTVAGQLTPLRANLASLLAAFN